MSKIIHVFDLDDTLTITPTFADMLETNEQGYVTSSKFEDGIENVQKYITKIRAAFWDRLSKNVMFKKSGDFIVIVDADTKVPIKTNAVDYFTERKWQRIFSVMNGYVILEPYPGFHSDPNTIGKKVNEPVLDTYNSVSEKMILTGRDEDLRGQIEETIGELGIEYPNYGFYMYSRKNPLSIKDFKTQVMFDSIEKHGWNEIHFYEDKQDWLHHAEGAINERYPEVKFVAHYIDNIKSNQRLS